MSAATSPALRAHYFDGRSSRARPVLLSVHDGQLRLASPDSSGDAPALRELPARDVRWPERMRHGARIAHLPDGATIQALDAAQWDAWVTQNVQRDSLVVKAQQSWHGVAAAFGVLVLVLAASYLWGLPLAARGVVSLVPETVDTLLGEQTLRSIDSRLMQPSQLPPADQMRIREAFTQAVSKTHGSGAPDWRLEFRKGKADESGKSMLGPNAFALPGGTMVLTDELVNLVQDDQVVLGVLGHELGHVRQRHGMRQLVQVSALGAIASVAFGDYGTLISTAPVLVATMGYSRDAEREADAESVRLMKAAGISPLVMVKFFEAMRAERSKSGQSSGAMGIAFSSHPADEERIERFRQAAAR